MQKSSIDYLSAGSRDDFPVVITSMPATARHYKIAYGGFIVLLVLVAIVTPFANVPLRRVDAFTPVTQTVFCIANLLTATFLFAHTGSNLSVPCWRWQAGSYLVDCWRSFRHLPSQMHMARAF